jgi:O-antigen/teichoic acid export membrane protein
VLNRRMEQQERVQPEVQKQVWKPGTFGFASNNGTGDDDPDFDKLATIPVMVLRGITKQQGSPQPVMKSEISAAAGSAAYVSAGNIGGSILKYGSNIVIQRGFGAAAFGLYTLSMSVVSLAAAIFNLGLDDAMVRYVSIYRAKRQSSSLRGLTIFCTAVVGGSGILGAFLVLYFAPILGAIKHSPEMIPILQLMAPMVPLISLQAVWISGLQGFKEFKWRVLVQRILIPISLILLMLGALIFFHNLNAIVIATLINATIGTILSLLFYFRRSAGAMKQGSEAYELRVWFGFAAPNFLTSIVDTVLESIDTLLLAYFAISNMALGQYAAAIKISNFILMPQASFNAMFAPTIAELHSQGEQQKLAAMFKVVTKWAITFSLPIFGIAILFASSLLGIGGDSFVPAWPLVIAFAVGTMVNVSTGSVSYVLLMTGHTKVSFLNSLTAVIVNIVVGCILAPRYGAMGVAIATGLAMCVVNMMRLLQVRLLVKMQPYRWDVLKPLGAWLISTALTSGLLYLLNSAHLYVQIYSKHFSFELFLVPVFLASYIGLLALFKISPEDKIVLDMLRKKFRRGKKNRKR